MRGGPLRGPGDTRSTSKPRRARAPNDYRSHVRVSSCSVVSDRRDHERFRHGTSASQSPSHALGARQRRSSTRGSHRVPRAFAPGRVSATLRVSTPEVGCSRLTASLVAGRRLPRLPIERRPRRDGGRHNRSSRRAKRVGAAGRLASARALSRVRARVRKTVGAVGHHPEDEPNAAPVPAVEVLHHRECGVATHEDVGVPGPSSHLDGPVEKRGGVASTRSAIESRWWS